MLIQETLPLEYGNLTQVLISSTDKTYIMKRLKIVKFYAHDFKYLINLIKKIIDLDRKKKFLLKQEKIFLNHANKLFKNRNHSVKIKEYAKLLEYSFNAVVTRLLNVQKKLIHSIKKSQLDVKDFDNEYLFALQNILDQVSSLLGEIKKFKWDNQDLLISLSRKAQMVYRNLNEVVMSISLEHYDDIKSLSNAILDSINIKFKVTDKIFA